MDNKIKTFVFSWNDVHTCMPKNIQDILFNLSEEEVKRLVEKYTESIGKYLEHGIMYEWTVAMESAIQASGLLQDPLLVRANTDETRWAEWERLRREALKCLKSPGLISIDHDYGIHVTKEEMEKIPVTMIIKNDRDDEYHTGYKNYNGIQFFCLLRKTSIGQ